MEGFWSEWWWPLATAVLGFVYAGLVFKQWLRRRKPHQLMWTIGLTIYAVAAGMEAYSEFGNDWDQTVYRFYIVLAASMVGFLGNGTLYLMTRKRTLGDTYLAINVLLIAVFLWGVFTTPLLTDLLRAGITVGGKPLGETFSFPRVMSFAFNIPGTLLLLGGALLSIVKFARKREYAYRAWGNVLIAAGTIVIAAAGSRARAGQTVGLYPAEMIASALLLWGFLVAGTLDKGVAAIRAKREASEKTADMPPVSGGA